MVPKVTVVLRLARRGLWIAFEPVLVQLDRAGGRVSLAWSFAAELVATAAAVVWLALRPSTWTRASRDVLVRQLLFTAVEALPFVLRLSLPMGVLLVVQAEMWLRKVGGEEGIIEPFLWQAMVRELGPLLATLVVIVRSSTAIATELATMRLAGEIDVLDSQGLDPMSYLVVPRVVAVACAVFCLAVVQIAATFSCGYLVGALMGMFESGPHEFFNRLVADVSRDDLLFFLPKTLLAGLFIGVISTLEGLNVRRAMTEVPQAASRSAVRSLSAVFLVSALLSLMVYGRILIFEVT